MSVYVDHYRAPLGRMKMSHMIADTELELDEMADRLGLLRKWKQAGPPVHYDISEGKRALAVRYGATVMTSRDLVRHLRKLRGNS